ncbi:NXPE family member 3-like [Peromyscus leucopus]|uniref:NXPE family member 3-like n=1 Tax=Peromyscus leucopus TaxID=10041 RepID=UPI001885113D|nr:NXPE family member 3-like [Peromyscus leucopus]
MQNPKFSEKPAGLIDLLDSVLFTPRLTWDDCYQSLQVLYTTEEGERILEEAEKLALGPDTLLSGPPCRPGHLSPKPSGFYHQDRWHSTFCSSRSFPTVDSILNCLAGRIVYMMGDSTLRQWWEYLRDTVPSLKPVDLHVTYQAGPLMAVDTTRGTVLHWRAHGWPLRSLRTPVASLHSVARELHGLAGAPPRWWCWVWELTLPPSIHPSLLEDWQGFGQL